MRKCFALLPALLSSLLVLGQKVDKADLLMTTCDLDPDASAYILLKTGETDFNLAGSGFLETRYHFQVKILKDKGVQWANVVIPYYSYERYDEVDDISGETYNLDAGGNIVSSRLEKSGIFSKPLDKYYSEVVFTLPDVKKGSVIEFSYTKISRNFTNIEAWNFQDEIPTRYSQFYLAVPSYFDFTYTVHQTIPVEVKDVNDEARAAKTFTMRNVPGLEDEPYMSARRDYLQRIDFQIAAIRYPGQAEKTFRTSWDKLNEEMLDNDAFGAQLHKNIPHADSLDVQLRALTDSTARMAAVLGYVRRSMTWTHVYAWHSQSVRDAWDKGSGSMGDINLILVDLLREAGLKAYPLLVSTRSHGMVNTADPMLSQFNAVMAYVRVQGHTYILNAADRYTPYRFIPYEVRSSKGFVVDSRASGWVTLVDNETGFKNTVVINGVLDERGHLRATAAVLSYDYSKIARRRRLDDGLDYYKQNFFIRPYNGLSVDSLQVSGQDDDTLPLQQDLHFFMSLQHSGEYWFFTPNLFTGLEKNPFVGERRFSDVDFGYTQSYTVVGSIDIPDGFKLETLPRNIRMITQDTSIVLERVMQADDGRLNYRISVDFKRPVYFAGEYDTFREFYKRLFTTLNEQVILRKKA